MQWAHRHLSSQKRGELSCSFIQDLTQFYFILHVKAVPNFKEVLSSIYTRIEVSQWLLKTLHVFSESYHLSALEATCYRSNNSIVVLNRENTARGSIFLYIWEENRLTVSISGFILIERLLTANTTHHP